VVGYGTYKALQRGIITTIMWYKVTLRKRLGQFHGRSNLLSAEADLAEIYVGEKVLAGGIAIGSLKSVLCHALISNVG